MSPIHSFALRFVRSPRSGKVIVRAVAVTGYLEAGGLGKFAMILTGDRDRRTFARRHPAEPVAVDARELLPLVALETLKADQPSCAALTAVRAG